MSNKVNIKKNNRTSPRLGRLNKATLGVWSYMKEWDILTSPESRFWIFVVIFSTYTLLREYPSQIYNGIILGYSHDVYWHWVVASIDSFNSFSLMLGVAIAYFMALKNQTTSYLSFWFIFSGISLWMLPQRGYGRKAQTNWLFYSQCLYQCLGKANRDVMRPIWLAQEAKKIGASDEIERSKKVKDLLSKRKFYTSIAEVISQLSTKVSWLDVIDSDKSLAISTNLKKISISYILLGFLFSLMIFGDNQGDTISLKDTVKQLRIVCSSLWNQRYLVYRHDEGNPKYNKSGREKSRLPFTILALTVLVKLLGGLNRRVFLSRYLEALGDIKNILGVDPVQGLKLLTVLINSCLVYLGSKKIPSYLSIGVAATMMVLALTMLKTSRTPAAFAAAFIFWQTATNMSVSALVHFYEILQFKGVNDMVVSMFFNLTSFSFIFFNNVISSYIPTSVTSYILPVILLGILNYSYALNYLVSGAYKV